MNEHLERARHFIEIAESADSKREAYLRAADEIIAAQKEDPSLGFRAIGEAVGRATSWCQQLVNWRTSDLVEVAGPFSEAAGKPNRDESGLRKVLRERPEVVGEALKAVSPEQRAGIVREALKDPEVAREVVKDDAAVAGVHQAIANQPRTERDPSPREQRAARDDAYLEVLGAMIRFVREAGEALPRLREAELTDNQIASLEEQVARHRNILDWVMEPSAGFDSALAEILKETS